MISLSISVGMVNKMPQKKGLPPFAERAPELQRRARVFFGHRLTHEQHLLLPEAKPYYYTFLREPAARAISHYNWDMNQEVKAGRSLLSFEDWFFGWGKQNWMSKFLLQQFFGLAIASMDEAAMQEELRARLPFFYFIGNSDVLNVIMQSLGPFLGVATPFLEKRNRSGVEIQAYLEPHPHLLEWVRGHCALDCWLFETYAKSSYVREEYSEGTSLEQ